MNNRTYQNFTVTIDEPGVVRISMNVPGRPLNILNQSVMGELKQIVNDLEANSTANVVVFESGKDSGFLAGADVNAIVGLESSEQALEVLNDGQTLFQRIEALTIPTVAVIHGPCLGGGLELCLACNYRIARDDGSTKIGLPEISLGVIPGWGGTQRMPKLVGLIKALEMILKGKHVGARDALRMGLIDQKIKPEQWEQGVDLFVQNVANGQANSSKKQTGLMNRLLEGNSIGRKLVFRTTAKKIASKAKNYPALNSAMKAIASFYQRGADGYAVERDEFAKLLETTTCRSLLSLFVARETARNVKTWSGQNDPGQESKIQKVAVVGAGAMGAGIAQLAAINGFQVVVKEINTDAAQAGRQRIDGLINKLASRKGWSEEKRQSVSDNVELTCEVSDLSDSDLIVEAIVERLDVKQSLFSELNSLVKPDTILATNTSSLSVDAMAEATSSKDQFGGLHFFNPVHRMELVEVVRGQSTSPETIAKLVSFTRSLGKTPIVTSDSPGFLVNRVLFPYLGEAVLMVREGYSIEKIDKELRRFGMPMGPLELLDQVGIDVAKHVAISLSSILRGLESVPDTLSSMVDNGQLGKKTGVGFYEYAKGKKGKPSSTSSSAPVSTTSADFRDDGLTEIQRRLVYPMLMESIRCHEEQVVEQPWAIDLAMVLGTGFAPHRGGPLHVVDQIGAEVLSANAKQMSQVYGPRFSPPETLVQMTATGSGFFNANKTGPRVNHVASS